MTLAEARLRAQDAIRVDPDGNPVIAELAAQAIQLQVKLDGLARLELEAEAEARIRKEWEGELESLRARIGGKG